jgi:hypothetical protein
VDIFNLFNSDAIDGYNSTYTLDNPATTDVEVNNWGTPTSLMQPRLRSSQSSSISSLV